VWRPGWGPRSNCEPVCADREPVSAKPSSRFPEIGNSRLETGLPIGLEETHSRRSPISAPAEARRMRPSPPVVAKSPKPGMRGWGGRIRTSVWRNQNPLPYRLATPQSAAGPEGPAESGRTIVRAPKRRNGLDGDFATSPKGRAAALSELGRNKTVICGCSSGRATAAALFERGSKDGRSSKHPVGRCLGSPLRSAPRENGNRDRGASERK
jgi:hypothetical protein